MKLLGFSALALTVAIFAVGCAASAADEADGNQPAASSEDLTSAAPAASVLDGTFDLHDGSTSATNFHTLTLNADHSYKALGGCPQSGPGPHCFAIIAFGGTWKTKKSADGKPQIELTNTGGDSTDYFYSLKSDQLSLSLAAHGTASLFDKDISHLPKLHSFDVCADKFDNSLGLCPEDLPCEFDGPDGKTQRCLPPI